MKDTLAKRSLWLAGAALSVVSPLCRATTNTQGDADTVTLEPVVVSASREGTSLQRTPAAIGQVNAADIDRKKATFVGELLDAVPGVHVADLGNEQHNMSIRQPLSYQANYLYLEDGLPIRPVGLFNHNALYEINLDGVGAIEVLKGPASSLYGSNAIGGAVNFLTRHPTALPSWYAGFQSSDQGMVRLEAGASGTVGVHGLRVDSYASRRRGGWSTYNDSDKRSLSLKHEIELPHGDLLRTTLTRNSLTTDMPGTLGPTQYRADPGASQQTFAKREVRATRLSTSLEAHWWTGGLTTVTLFARDNVTNQLPSYLIFDTGPSTALGRTSDQSFTSLGAELRHRQILSQDLRVVAGVTADRSPMDAAEKNLSVVRDPASGRYLSYTELNPRRDYSVLVRSAATYAQLEWQAAPAVVTVLGARADFIEYGYSNHLLPSATTGAPSEQRTYHRFSPKAGIVWSTSPDLIFFANLSQGFAPPEVTAQYGGALAAPDLRPSVFNNFDVGSRLKLNDGATRLDLAAYWLDGKDEVLSYSLAPGRSEPRNAGSTRHTGLEFGATHRVTESLEASISGAFAKHQYRDYRVSDSLNYAGNLMKAAPKVLGQVGLSWTVRPAWRVSGDLQYVSSYWMDDANTVRYDGHRLVNLRSDWSLGRLELWLSVRNATNRRYAEMAASTFSGTGPRVPEAQDSYTPGAPRTILFGMRYAYGDKP